jgi:hypothetical protein
MLYNNDWVNFVICIFLESQEKIVSTVTFIEDQRLTEKWKEVTSVIAIKDRQISEQQCTLHLTKYWWLPGSG